MGDGVAGPASGGPILVAGSMGSGSTLLRLMLDSHENIAIPGETGFLRLALTHTFVPYWQLGDQWYGNLGLSEAELFARLGEFYGGLFADYAAARGKSRWGEKTPFHVWHLELATRLFPDCRIVGIVRHPGAVTSSLRRRFRYDTPRAAQHWHRTTKRLLMSAMVLGDRCALIRYEDLVRSPETIMRAVLEHVGEPWSPSVLAHHEVQADGNGQLESDGFTRIDRPLDATGLDRWESRLNAADRAQLTRLRRLATFLGYDVNHTFPITELANPPRPLLKGSDLARRRRTYPCGVKWRQAPAPGLANAPLRPLEPVASLTPAMRSTWRLLPERVRRKIHQARRNRPSIGLPARSR
jgi:hypothetical protein